MGQSAVRLIAEAATKSLELPDSGGWEIMMNTRIVEWEKLGEYKSDGAVDFWLFGYRFLYSLALLYRPTLYLKYTILYVSKPEFLY